MKEITLKIKKVTILERSGTDLIMFDLDVMTPFPEMKYPPLMQAETRKGYAKEWLKENFGITEAEVIKI